MENMSEELQSSTLKKLDLNNYLDRFKGDKKAPPHERAYYVDEISGIIDRPFKVVLGLTRDWPLEWLKWSYYEAQKAKNPAIYWWWYRKQTLVR